MANYTSGMHEKRGKGIASAGRRHMQCNGILHLETRSETHQKWNSKTVNKMITLLKGC